MKNWFINHFSLSRKEIQGIAFLTCIVIIIWMLPSAYRLLATEPDDPNLEARRQEIIQFVEQIQADQSATSKGVEVEVSPAAVEYFPFDPNHLSAEDGKRLGLNEAQIRMIHNYVAKGGRFYRKEDFAKIYAISEADYERLATYIDIRSTKAQKDMKPGQYSQPQEHVKPTHFGDTNSSRPSFAKRPSKKVMINLNTTDSIELLDLYGIGPSFAARIIKYRDLLGGYYSKDQLLEVYGMDADRFAGFQEQVFVQPEEVQKISINTIQYRELLTHPYVTPRQANSIVQYRNQHGDYKESADLLGIEILNEEFLRKIVPYLSFDNEN